jgi:hypothetical protein
VFVPGKLFQPNLMFVAKAVAYLSEAPFRCSTLGQVPAFTNKHWTRQEKLTRDKRSGLLLKFVKYGQKSFIILATGQVLALKNRPRAYFFEGKYRQCLQNSFKFFYYFSLADKEIAKFKFISTAYLIQLAWAKSVLKADVDFKFQ